MQKAEEREGELLSGLLYLTFAKMIFHLSGTLGGGYQRVQHSCKFRVFSGDRRFDRANEALILLSLLRNQTTEFNEAISDPFEDL
ncbi:hypothetical protein VTO42DRAFT_9044 [Malbranchea cinnamomea]